MIIENLHHLAIVVSDYEKSKDFYVNKLGFEVIRPDGTFYIMPKALPEADGLSDSIAFCRKALQHDLVFVPADGFGAPGYFRVAYCVETQVVERAIPVLRRFVEEEYKGV